MMEVDECSRECMANYTTRPLPSLNSVPHLLLKRRIATPQESDDKQHLEAEKRMSRDTHSDELQGLAFK